MRASVRLVPEARGKTTPRAWLTFSKRRSRRSLAAMPMKMAEKVVRHRAGSSPTRHARQNGVGYRAVPASFRCSVHRPGVDGRRLIHRGYWAGLPVAAATADLPYRDLPWRDGWVGWVEHQADICRVNQRRWVDRHS